MKWTIPFALVLALLPPPAAPCPTPAPLTMPTAASGRPVHERPTYSAAFAMPTGVRP